MHAEIRILTGARAGTVLTVARETIAIGRHPDADLRFDPDADLAVSVRHALIRWDGEGWSIYDLDSRNGTFVNGRRATPASPLRDGDQVELGAGGPVVEFRATPAGAAAAGDAAPSATIRADTTRIRADTTRIRAEVDRQTSRLRRAMTALAAAAAVLVVGLAGAFLTVRRVQLTAWDSERAAMQQRVDSILAASEAAILSLRDELDGLARALRRSRSEVERLTAEVEGARARGDAPELLALQRQLQTATTALQRQQLAAALDTRAIERANRPAVALVFVEADDGVVSTGTAFAIRPDATFLTSRHVVAGADGRGRPRRVAIQFSDSDQVWPARVLAVSDETDLAVLKVDNIVGEVPTVRGLNLGGDTLRAGVPVAAIGFPLGGGAGRPADRRTIAKPLVSVGVLLGNDGGRLDVQGYGAAGASGSPIFDQNGEVVGVLFGGRQDSTERVVVAVPAAAAARLLESLRLSYW